MGNSKYTINHFVSSRNKVLYEDHFHPNCIARDLRFKLMAESSGIEKKELVPGAIRTIFSYKIYDQVNMDDTVVLKRHGFCKCHGKNGKNSGSFIFYYEYCRMAL